MTTERKGTMRKENREKGDNPEISFTKYGVSVSRKPYSIQRKKKRLKLDLTAGLRGYVHVILAPLFVLWGTVINF